MTLTFDEDRHTYEWNGQRLTSMTALVRRFAPFDRDRIAAETAARRGVHPIAVKMEWQDRADLGTAVHNITEQYLRTGKRGSEWQAFAAHVEPIVAFLEKNEITPVDIEHRVCNPKYSIAGTIDLVGRRNGKLYLVDYKTTRRLKREGWNGEMMKEPLDHLPRSNYWEGVLQLAGYQFILEDEHGTADGLQEPRSIAGRILLWVPGDGAYRVAKTPRMYWEALAMFRDDTTAPLTGARTHRSKRK